MFIVLLQNIAVSYLVDEYAVILKKKKILKHENTVLRSTL